MACFTTMKSTKMHKSIDMIPHCILNDNNYVIWDQYGLKVWDEESIIVMFIGGEIKVTYFLIF